MDINQKCVNTLRLLSVNQIEKANSGHPGVALGAAPVLFTLYNRVMSYNAGNTKFFNRDRFVLSAGHGSSLLYATLHMFGFDVKISDLKSFRRLGSITPGHPEYLVTEGVETSTGPLGQGISNSVGMAIAEKHMASIFNKENIKLIDNHIYCLAGDGCLMEGIGVESLSIAGNLKLDNFTLIYDSNNITIEGKTNLTFTEDTRAKYEALGFEVFEVLDANNLEELEKELLKAKKAEKPSLVIVNSKIGYGSHLEGTNTIHGKPLDNKGIEVLKQNLGFKSEPFTVSEEAKEFVSKKALQGEQAEKEWNKLLESYKTKYPQDYELLNKYLSDDFKEQAIKSIEKLSLSSDIAIRDMGHLILQQLNKTMPNLIGGTADVAPSTKAFMKEAGSFSSKNYAGKNLHYGIREHAMAGISNGIVLYGGLFTYASTYMAFTDYMKGGMRLSALMELPVLYYVTHDSVLIGQDGPTHQAVEQLVTLRATPNLKVWRPANKKEVKAGFIAFLKTKKPTVMVLAKQKNNVRENNARNIEKGGYIINHEIGELDLILMATGSEVELAQKARLKLEEQGINTRVVSIPCFEEFDNQDESYKEEVLPNSCRNRLAIEAGSAYSFHKYVGLDGNIISVDEFGESGTQEELATRFNLTVDKVVEIAKKMF
jgi:transketolase